MTYVWFGAMLLFVMLEASTVSLVSVWFAMGSLAALLVSLFTETLWIQFVVFLAVSGLLLAALRPLVRRYIKPKLIPTNLDSVIGTIGFVTEDIDNLIACGRVKLGGNFWSARSTAGVPIAAGTRIRVDRIEGNKVFVSSAEDFAET